MQRSVLIVFLAGLLFTVPVQAFTISGHLDGVQPGFTLSYVFAVPTTLDTFYIGIGIPILNTYAILNVQAGTYVLFAFQDLSGNVLPDLDEPRGFYGGTPPEFLVMEGDTDDVDIELLPPNSGGFTGTVTYAGSVTGATFIFAHRTPAFTDSIRGIGVLFTNNGNGAYTAFVDSFGTYYAYAFMDQNTNFTYDEGEPYGAYGGATPIAIDVQPTDFPDNIDITMEDPSAAPFQPVVLPLATQLSTIYPNPFNSETTITFTLATAGHVELSLYDVLGRAVNVITNREYSVGEHRVWLSADGLPAGLYFASLRSGTNVSVQRVLLLK